MSLQLTTDNRRNQAIQRPERIGKDEMNFAEFPFASLRNRGDKRKALVYKGWATDAHGNRYEQEWITQGGSLVGIPTEFDERVFIALVAISDQQDFQDRRVELSLYQIIKIMGLTHNNRSYQYIENSLERLLAATFTSKQAFWDHGRQERITTVKGFHLIDGYWLRYKEVNREIAEEEGVPGYILWSEVVWNSFRAGFIKNLDLDFFFSLQSPVARRLYRFLDKKMHYQDQYEIDIFDLGARMALTRYAYPSKVIEKLQPGIDEIILRSSLGSAEVVKFKKYTRLRFTKGAGILPVLEAAEVHQSEEEQENNSSGEKDPKREVVEALLECGISEKVADKLSNRYSRERILEKIEFLEFMQATNPKAVKRPSGWLRRAIEENYASPDNFTTNEQRAAEQDAKNKKRQALREQFFAEEERERLPSWIDQVYEEIGASEELQELTDSLQQYLMVRMSKAVYEMHLSRIAITSIDDTTAVIAVPNRVNLEWLDGRLKPQVEQALTQIMGYEIAVQFRVQEFKD